MPYKKYLLALLFFYFLFFLSCKSTINSKPLEPISHNENTTSSDKPQPVVDGLKISTHDVNRNINATLKDPTLSPFCDIDTGSAVILMYHKFDEPYKSTSVTVQQFIEQMEFFKNNNYTVVTLEQVVAAIKGQIPFEKKWIAITIDDAYKSFLKVKPILEDYGYPYTIFVNTEAIDKGFTSSMNWEDLKMIASSSLASLASHSHSHAHLVRGMNSTQRKQDILLSVERIYQNTSIMPQFFSYPFGESSSQLVEDIKSINQVAHQPFQFTAAFSTQSGPAGCSSDIFAIPRFAINENYGVINELFNIKMNSLHLPVTDYHPKNKAICIEDKIDTIYFSTSTKINLKNINCYASRGNKTQVDTSPHGLVRVSLEKPLGFGIENPKDIRERVNCTIFHKGQYFWYGREFTILQNSSECSH